MTEDEIYARLTDIMREVFDDDDLVITPQTTSADIPGWDSQAHITLIVATEMRFNVRFRTAEVESLKNVDEFVKLIAQKSVAA